MKSPFADRTRATEAFAARIGVIEGPGIVDPAASPSEDIPYNLVDVIRCFRSGAELETTAPLAPGTRLDFMYYDPRQETWSVHWSEVLTCHSRELVHRVRLRFLPARAGLSSDLRFLMRSRLFNALPQRAFFMLINVLKRLRLKAGDRLVEQGQTACGLYLIQEGRCLARVEKEGQFIEVEELREGDVAGEMALLTGEPQVAHIVAAGEVTAWSLDSHVFLRLASNVPEIRVFLTELAASRFESWSETADRQVGKYVIKHKLGKGGYSIVYHGVHKDIRMPAAIKMLRHDMAMDAQFQKTFRAEAEVIAALNHPNIVQVYDIEELYQTVFIVMERLEGQSLHDLLKGRRPLPLPRTVDILLQTLAGLEYAHGKGIVHRDIKPDNIFLRDDGQVKILDFGLACPAGVEDLSLPGTIQYAPPEQIEGEPVDGRADLYSLGITAYEMILGRRPYPEDDLHGLMDLRCTEEIPDPGELIPDLPGTLRRFILTCCRIDREKRYASAAEAAADLRHLHHAMAGLPDETSRPGTLMGGLLLFAQERSRSDLAGLVEDFKARAAAIGVTVQDADLGDE